MTHQMLKCNIITIQVFKKSKLKLDNCKDTFKILIVEFKADNHPREL